MTFSKLHIGIQAAIRSGAKMGNTSKELKDRLISMGVNDASLFDAFYQAEKACEEMARTNLRLRPDMGLYKIIICPADWDILDAANQGYGNSNQMDITDGIEGSPIKAIYVGKSI